MDFRPGQLVKVATGGPELDGIVVEQPSHKKVLVAVVDAQRGPVLKSCTPDTLSEREDEGPRDEVLHQFIRRTPGTHRGGATAGGGGAAQSSRGHARQASHRTTGK